MSLSPGTRLGPYEIVALIGAGGMGEVYRARDTRLDRTVALKVLPASSASDSTSRALFRREAHAIATVNHPHICVLHDIGEHGGIEFLVMEHLEGETLADRLRRGGIPAQEALDHAIQVADALDHAHRHGVVHRDLKPSNVMLTREGVKVLDFGIAKLRPVQAAGVVVGGALPTTASQQQEDLAILGTLNYMAPEQLEGREADHRTDIFAFGAIVYEMLSGRRAFDGRSRAAVVAAILEHDPPAVLSDEHSAASAVDRFVRVCLAKNPEQRWQSAADVVRALCWVRDDWDSNHRPSRVGRSRWTWWWVTAAAALAAVWLMSSRGPRSPPTIPDEVRFSVPAPTEAGWDTTASFSLSPDARRLALTAMSGSKALLWIREISSVVARPLWGTEGASYPFWSPDGNNIGFFADGKLKKITLPTGMIETICRVDRPAGGTWNNQDVIIFAPSDGQEGLYRISSAGGDASLVMRSGTGRVHRWPFFLPDGRRFGVSLDHLGVLYLGALDSKKTERLLFDAPGAAFAEPDYLLFWRDRQLVGQRFDLRGGRLLDETFVIADDVARDAMRPHFSVSRAGALAFRQQAPHETRPQWVDRSGRRVGPIDELSGYRYVETGPDGRTISATQFEPLTQLTTTQLIDLQTHRKSRVTSLRGANGLPVWSRDRSKIAFTVGDFVDTKPGLYAITAGGSRSEALLLQKHVFATDWSSDDRFILFQAEHPDSGWDIRMMPISGDRTPVPLLTTRANEHSACLSPTGRWLAFVSDVSGSPEVYVARFPEMTERRRISPAGGMTPAWRADGKELFFMASDGFLTAVAIVDGEQFRTSTLEPLFQLRMTTYRPTFARGVSVTEDGSRFLVPWYAMLDNKPPQLEPITMVLNWRPPVRPLDDGQAATGASATARSNERR